MDFKAAVDLIIRELQTTGELIDDFKNYDGVPSLQVELARSKLANVSKLVELLSELKKREIPGPEPVKKEPEIPKPAKKETVKQEVLMPAPPKVTSVEKEKPASEEINIIHTPEPVTEARTPGRTILGESFGSQTERLNEQLGNRRIDGDVTGNLRSVPVKNLKDAIGTNDKFLFIREIFQGNTETYNKAIDDLNSSGSFSDAHSRLMSYTGGTAEGDAITELVSLLKRKFPADE